MEKMENEYCTLFRDVAPSVVLVEQVGHINNFCIGSVILSEGENTFILTQSNIAKASAKLSVRFSNGYKQTAAVLKRSEHLCVLVTKFYPKAKVVQFFEGVIDHSYAAAIAPASKSSVYNIPGFIIQRSLESSCPHMEEMITDSENYFIFTCRYGDKSPDTVSRLLSGPVFHLDGQVVGVVLYDMEHTFFPQRTAKLREQFHEEFYVKMGFFFKVAVCVRKLQDLLSLMAENPDWRNGLKEMAQKGKGAP